MQETWEKGDDMQKRLSEIQTDSLNQRSFPHTNNSVFIVKFMLFGRWCRLHFFITFFCQQYMCSIALCTMTWRSVVIALHIERTILVFQRRTLLHPFPHINLCRVFFLTVVLMCAGTMINMPLPSCDKILQISLPAYLQLQSPYYFWKVVWSLSLDYSIPCSTSYAPHVPSSFKCVFSPGMEYGNVF